MTQAERVRKTGYFLYDGQVRCPVRIVETDVRPGSGDFEDEPDVAEDQPGTWFRIELTVAGSPGHWASSIEGFKSLAEAMEHLGPAVIWDP